MADEKKPIEPLAPPPRPEAGNTPERLHYLEKQVATQAKRIEFLENANRDLILNVREEAMRLLGTAFGTLGEQLLVGAVARHKYKAEECNAERPINEQTFYARQITPGQWAYHVMQPSANGDVATEVVLERLASPMAVAVQEFISKLPADTPSVAFNVYREA